jgi:hypothetical protein
VSPLARLACIVLVLGFAAGPLLSRGAWSHRLPKVAALAWLPTFRTARRALPLLLEMTADEIAARTWGRDAVAVALRKLAVLPTPVGGLAAGASDGSQLGRRLARLETSPPDGAHVQRLTWITATTSIAVPVLISAAWIATTPLFC